MAGGTEVFHRTITRRRALVGMNKKQQQHQKPSEGKTMGPRGANAIRVPKNELDTADFLIDGSVWFPQLRKVNFLKNVSNLSC
jgi:hypothetical protein